jgi:hypothetical protein
MQISRRRDVRRHLCAFLFVRSEIEMHSQTAPKDTSSLGGPDQVDLSAIKLRYGSVKQVLVDMGYRGSTPEKTFNDYIKSLRKLGIPVWAKTAPREGHCIIYSYENVMDLVLALSMRVYNGVPDTVLRKLVDVRPALHRLYRQAYEERHSGLGSPLRVANRGEQLVVTGVFLDLNLDHAGGRLVSFGPPKALSPLQAIASFTHADAGPRAFHPIRLSALCERVAELSRDAMLLAG